MSGSSPSSLRPWLNQPITAATTAAIRMGTPAGTNGTASTVASAQTTAIATGSLPFSRGHSRPRNAATAAPSSPHCFGSPSAPPARAPTAVKRFQSTKIPMPAVQKPLLLLGRIRLPGACGRGLVDGQLGGGIPAPPPRAEQDVELHAVDPVAHPQQGGRSHGRQTRAAAGNHPDECKL